MAKETKKAKTETKTGKAVEAKTKKATDFLSKFKGMTVKELKLELQKLSLAVKTGDESDTSKIKKLKKYIARELTKANSNI